MSNTLFKKLEKVEAMAWGDMYKAATPEISKKFGIDIFEAGSAVGGMASKFDVLALNRVIGLGIEKDITDKTIENIISKYKKHNVPRFFIQLCSEITNPQLPGRLESNGFHHHNNWVKLYRDISPVTGIKSDLKAKEIGPDDGLTFGKIIVESFDWPKEMAAWIACVIGRPCWKFYMAYDNDMPVATAGMYIHDSTVWIDFAATLESVRGRGAQGLLLKRRIDDAREVGCDTVVVETAEETPEKSAPSYRNMIRYGFKLAYIRPNYIFVNN
jgi:GNAT superfamily N-acetyltransferase